MFSYDVEASEIHLYDEIGPEWAGMVGGSSVVDALKMVADLESKLARLSTV